MDINEQAEIMTIRTLLNKGNITRTILSLFGTVLTGISIYRWKGKKEASLLLDAYCWKS